MKKTLLLLSMFLLSAGLFSQTIITTWEFGPTSFAPSITFNGEPTDGEIVCHIGVTNAGASEITLNVARQQLNMVEGSRSQFCWGGSCWSFEQDTSLQTLTLGVGESTDEFSGHYRPEGTIGVSTVRYSFWDVNDPSSFSSVIVMYNTVFSLSCLDGDSVSEHIRHINGNIDDPWHGVIKVHNHVPAPLNLIVLKTMVPPVVPNTTNWMWFGGNEYAFGVDTTGVNTIPASTTDESFEAFYDADGNYGLTQIIYAFMDPTPGSEGNFALYSLQFGSGVGIGEETLANTTFSAPYPNPAESYVNFDFDIPNEVNRAEILITNLLGAVVYEGNIGSKTGSKRIDVSNLNGGIYFATLRLDGQIAATQKVLVK